MFWYAISLTLHTKHGNKLPVVKPRSGGSWAVKTCILLIDTASDKQCRVLHDIRLAWSYAN